jgi:hypothetical protein
MIIDKTGLLSIKEQGDNFVFTHAQNVAPTIAQANDIYWNSDNGWSQEREFRQIGCIPEATFQWLMTARPDIAKDSKKLKAWLMSDEGRPYRTVRALRTGRSGKAIVK